MTRRYVSWSLSVLSGAALFLWPHLAWASWWGGSSGGASIGGFSSPGVSSGGFTISGYSIPAASWAGTSQGIVWTPTNTGSPGYSFSQGSGWTPTNTGSPGYSSTGFSWAPYSGYSSPLTQVIGTSTPGFQSIGNGQYTYNGCASQGNYITAYNAATGLSYCQRGNVCPAGEVQINNDGVCQGTGTDNPGTYAQWTFSSCVNGTQTEYTHNVTTGAVVSSSTISCVASPAPSSSSTSGYGYAPPVYTPPACVAPGPSTTTSPAGSSFTPTGCAGSCTSTGCSQTGVVSGLQTNTTQTCTTTYSCPGPTAQTSCSTSSTSTPATQSSATQCQQTETLLNQCMPNEPGYREAEYCLTFNGGTTNCSAPFGVYDPTNCPVPVGVGSGS